MPYTAPSFRSSAFNCPYCNAYAKVTWAQLSYYAGHFSYDAPMHLADCSHCKKKTFWLEDPHPKGTEPTSGRMVVPSSTIAPLPHPDMPADVKQDYEEARNISAASPRGAAALLRLAIQKLCVHQGGRGENLNEDIGSLVKKGLPVEIQQALDIVRVIGNNAVHPGELDTSDVEDVASALFELVNQIVEDRISRPKKLELLFKKLPDGAKQAIKKRDS